VSPITRTWLGFAAIGAGLVHLALVVGSPLPLAILLAGLGIAEFGWGVVTFANDALIAPRLARIVAIAPLLAWSLVVVVATMLDAGWIAASLPLVPMLVASIFELFVAGVITRHLRRLQGAASVVTPPTPGAGRYLLGLTVGALLVGGLTTPALAATEAGRYAQPHGSHDPGFVPEDPAPTDDDILSGIVLPDHDAGH